MKKHKTSLFYKICLACFAILVIYLAGCFSEAKLNISKWEHDTRTGISALMVLSSACIIVCMSVYEDENL